MLKFDLAILFLVWSSFVLTPIRVCQAKTVQCRRLLLGVWELVNCISIKLTAPILCFV